LGAAALIQRSQACVRFQCFYVKMLASILPVV
jgi:hypothetical protein